MKNIQLRKQKEKVINIQNYKLRKYKRLIQVFIIVGIGYFLISYSTENRKYKILNQIFVDTEFTPEKICIKKENIDYEREIFNEIDFYDIPSAYGQYLVQNAKLLIPIDDKIEVDKIATVKVVADCRTALNKIKIDDEIERWETNSNIQISLPILSIDKNTALIQISTNCGLLCGDTTLYAFKKNNGKWKGSKKKMLRIS